MSINTKQKVQLIVGGLSIVVLIGWLTIPGWEAGKILGIISMALIATSMALSFCNEEKRKNKAE